MNKIFLIPIIVLFLVSLSFAGTVISNDAVEAKFLADYQKVSTEKNSLELTTADYSDPAKNQVLVTQIDSSMGISIINFDISGKAITKISAHPEASVIAEEVIKCWHCESGTLNAYPATKTDCLANNDILFPDEAEKLCQPEPQTTCYICNTGTWIIDKEWLTKTQCLSKTNQYLVYDEANKACQPPEKPVLVDCYFCDGGYKLITSQECTDNGGHLLKEECEEKPIMCYSCDNIMGKEMSIQECKDIGGLESQEEAARFCGLIDCWTCAKPGILYTPVKDEKVCVENAGFLKIEDAMKACEI
jgi:hypothetical protein